mgnify:CR=1 FL=1
MDEIMDTLIKNTDDCVQLLSKPTDKAWSLPDLFIRQYLNNMVDGFGLSNVYEMYMYLLSKKNTLIELGMISTEGWNNSGYPLWTNYNFESKSHLSQSEISDLIKRVSRERASIK